MLRECFNYNSPWIVPLPLSPHFSLILGAIHLWRPWKLSNFQDPTHSACPSTSKIFPPLILSEPPSLQSNGIIKGWFHCLTRASMRRFLVNNILMFDSAWCLVVAQIQFSLIKKRLDVQNSCYTPTPSKHTRLSMSDNISFLPGPPLLTSQPPPQSERHMCITPYYG